MPRFHQAAKLVATILRVARATAGLVESNGSLLPDLWLTSPAGWLPRTGISSGTIRSVIEYGLPLPFYSYGSESRRTDRFIAFAVWRQCTPPSNTWFQIPRCVEGIGYGTVKSDRSVVVLHYFGLGHTIGFQAAVSDITWHFRLSLLANFLKPCKNSLFQDMFKVSAPRFHTSSKSFYKAQYGLVDGVLWQIVCKTFFSSSMVFGLGWNVL